MAGRRSRRHLTEEEIREIFADSESENDENEDIDEPLFSQDTEDIHGDIQDEDAEMLEDGETDYESQDQVVPDAENDHAENNRRGQGRDNLQKSWAIPGRKPSVQKCLANNPGPTEECKVTDNKSPIEYSELFLNEDLIDLLVSETNKYATQCRHTSAQDGSHNAPWRPVKTYEMKRFLGLVLLTGIIKKPQIKQYWATNEMLSTPYFSHTMSRDRFLAILKYLHFNDNENRPANDTDRLYKVKPVLDHMTTKYQQLYNPCEHIAIDEGMLKWRGRLGFRIYNPKKPTKYGILSYILCESSNGYCWNLIMKAEKYTMADVITTLLDDLKNKWRRLYMDNLYNSVSIAEMLLGYKTYVCGTLRAHRGEPEEVRAPGRLKKGEVLARDNGEVYVLVWKDKKPVKMISTMHDHSTTAVTRKCKTKPDGTFTEEVLKPTVITEYNQYMGGVDNLDQMISYYLCIRKTLKWPKKVFFYLTEIALYNSYVIYCIKNAGDKNRLLNFYMSVCQSLTSTPSSIDVSAESSTDSDTEIAPDHPQPKYSRRDNPSSRLIGGHKVHEIVAYGPTLKKLNPQRRCRVCSVNGICRDTRYYCKGCNVPLCVTNCFTKYHKKKRI